MGYYLLEYVLVDDYLARRGPLREAHLALAQEAAGRGDLVLAGALAEPPDRAVLVWRADDSAAVERFVAGDPYVRQGLVSSWTIRPWMVVVGAESVTARVDPPEPGLPQFRRPPLVTGASSGAGWGRRTSLVRVVVELPAAAPQGQP